MLRNAFSSLSIGTRRDINAERLTFRKWCALLPASGVDKQVKFVKGDFVRSKFYPAQGKNLQLFFGKKRLKVIVTEAACHLTGHLNLYK